MLYSIFELIIHSFNKGSISICDGNDDGVPEVVPGCNINCRIIKITEDRYVVRGPMKTSGSVYATNIDDEYSDSPLNRHSIGSVVRYIHTYYIYIPCKLLTE